MYEATYADGLLAKVDQKADVVPAPVQVEQALLYVLREYGASGFGLKQQLLAAIPDDEVHSPFGDQFAVVRYWDVDFPLEVQTSLGQRQLQCALIIHLHTVDAQLPLDVDTRTQHRMGERLECVPST